MNQRAIAQGRNVNINVNFRTGGKHSLAQTSVVFWCGCPRTDYIFFLPFGVILWRLLVTCKTPTWWLSCSEDLSKMRCCCQSQAPQQVGVSEKHRQGTRFRSVEICHRRSILHSCLSWFCAAREKTMSCLSFDQPSLAIGMTTEKSDAQWVPN